MAVADAALVVMNPVAGGGRALLKWRRLRTEVAARVDRLVLHQTTGPGDAARRAAEWVAAGEVGPVIVLGGDGTVHEVVNGMWAGGRMVPLVLIPAGTGNDFARNAGIPAGPLGALAVLGREAGRRYDLGLLEFREPSGAERRVVFVNSASVGVSPAANRYAQRLGRVLPGRLRYTAGGAWALLAGRRREFVVTGGGDEYRGVPLNITFANGPSFGGGMQISPLSSPYDGALDRVVIGAMGTVRALLALSRLYSGGHMRMREVSVTRMAGPATVSAPGPPIHVEADGHDFWAEGEVRVNVALGAMAVVRR